MPSRCVFPAKACGIRAVLHAYIVSYITELLPVDGH